MGPIGFPEMLVRNYNFSLRNNSEERSSHILRGGNLKSSVVLIKFVITTLIKSQQVKLCTVINKHCVFCTVRY